MVKVAPESVDPPGLPKASDAAASPNPLSALQEATSTSIESLIKDHIPESVALEDATEQLLEIMWMATKCARST